ncbi:P63C domain-containing protein [Malikia granosa]|jgi:P63C domain|uniref:Bacteriophage Mx8 p63 C-terminal domain-containing protein n=1 Tax=Malikia granosa TaxID=263067 RepID=A0A2S9K0S3_9BURK|nr:P63C domain-containing protein [Malikia granosa]PRD63967.1 hypothetical protein C6P64_16950 [Malikia granosa]
MDEEHSAEGRAKGGVAAARKLTAEQRKERAKQGAVARWGLKATHKGNFQQHLGIDVECYVLNDAKKTAVISQSGMAKALGLTERGNVLDRFISSQVMTGYVVAELAEKLKNPLVFQWSSGVAEVPPTTVKGFDASLLIDLCNAISSASVEGKLGKRYARIVQQASIINGASAKAGITGLVYALAGYRPEIEEVIQAFKMFVQEEAKKYEQEFPNELYLAWHRLYKIPILARGKPWQMMHLTRKHIYYPLAKSRGNILELLRALRDKDNQKKKLFVFLSDVGTRALRMHLGRVLEMAESSQTVEEYEAKITDRFGDQWELDLACPAS